jgi:hypothetical protein
MMVNAYNPSYQEADCGRLLFQGQDGEKVNETSSQPTSKLW